MIVTKLEEERWLRAAWETMDHALALREQGDKQRADRMELAVLSRLIRDCEGSENDS